MRAQANLANRIGQRRAQQILQQLGRKPHTVRELAKALGLNKNTVDIYLQAMRGTQVHVTAIQSYRAFVWAAGAGPDTHDTVPTVSKDVETPISTGGMRAIEDAQALAIELRGRPRSSPLQALVSATLHANQ